MNKKGMMISPQDWVKGFIIGIVVGLVVMYLIHKGIIPLPLP